MTTPVTLTAIAEDSGARLITQAELLANATDVDGPSLTAINLAIAVRQRHAGQQRQRHLELHPGAQRRHRGDVQLRGERRHRGTGGDHRQPRHHAGQRCADDHAGDAGRDRRGQRGAADHPGRAAGQCHRRRRTVADAPINLAIASGSGTLVNNGNGTWSYTPAANDDTAVTFSYAVSDGVAAPVATSASLDITPVNDAPATTPVTLAAIAEDSGAAADHPGRSCWPMPRTSTDRR